jgi:hypothetical protein
MTEVRWTIKQLVGERHIKTRRLKILIGEAILDVTPSPALRPQAAVLDEIGGRPDRGRI